MRVGNVEYYVVSDGLMQMDAGGVFGLVPRVLWERYVTPDDLNRIPEALNCLVVLSQGKKILIDNGLGDKLNAKQEANFGREGGSQLLANLAQLGLQPDDIDIVVDTHLHADHCGGNTRRVADQVLATFPRAEYWIQRLELADASYPNERTRATYLAENFKPLEEGKICLLEGDRRITDEVKCIVTRGHTRAHQSVVIESEGEKAIYLGDIAGRTLYMEKLSWIPAYDIEPLETLETKRRIRDWAFEENALLIFEHDPETVLGRMKKDRDRWRVEKVDS